VAAIRWVCLSDLHLGALNSILSSVSPDGSGVDKSQTSPVTTALCDGLRSLGHRDDPPQLIVAGDLFELALSSTDDASATFAEFICCLRPGGTNAAVAPLIRFIPGNHDHKLWSRARSRHYVDYLAQVAPDAPVDPESPVTHLLAANNSRPVRDEFVERLAARAEVGTQVVVELSYPNLGLVDPTGNRAVVLSHGHFVEPLYRIMSLVADCFTDGDCSVAHHLEGDNGGWIDFFWSSMGDSGDIGKWSRDLYEALQSQKSIKAVGKGIRRAVSSREGPWLRNHIQGMVVEQTLKRTVIHSLRRERQLPQVLSERSATGLLDYLDGPVAAQLASEVGSPSDVSFIFGHTHKPFSDMRTSTSYAEPVAVYNTGGWVVDTPEPEPVKGGSIIVIDEDLNVATIRCFSQNDQGTPCPVRVEGTVGRNDNPLVERLRDEIDPERDPWRALSEAAASTARDRRNQLESRLAAGIAAMEGSDGKRPHPTRFHLGRKAAAAGATNHPSPGGS
jgi:hypothetical protein